MDVLFAERDFIMFVNMKSRHHGTQPAIVIPSFNGGRLHVAIKIWQGEGVCAWRTSYVHCLWDTAQPHGGPQDSLYLLTQQPQDDLSKCLF